MPPVRSGLIEETQATVSSCEYHYAKLRDIDIDIESGLDKSYFVVNFFYEVNGRQYNKRFESSVSYEIGEHFTLLVNPSQPSINSVSQPDHDPLQIAIKLILGAIIAAIIIYTFRRFGLDELRGS